MYQRLLLLFLFAATATAASAHEEKEPGAMLRTGTWTGDVGTYGVPEALANAEPRHWPREGWYKLTIRVTSIESELVIAPRKEVPAFLQSIITQIENPQNVAVAEETTPSSLTQESPNPIYLRVPGARLREGSISSYVFKNGSSVLRPKLDHRYELELGGQPFAFVVRNGLRGRNGVPYGAGAHYTVEYGGNKFEYSLGDFGWDSTINAIADLDGDGKPDFIVNVGGSNSGYEAILLSSKAKPGENPATASLFASGC